MRNLFLVSYDVCDAKRLRKVYKKMQGFGKPAQYSVFFCPLSRTEKIQMLDQLGMLIKHDEDRIMIVDLGPEAGRGPGAVEFLGSRWEMPEDGPRVL